MPYTLAVRMIPLIQPPTDLFVFANELRSFGVEIEPVTPLASNPKLQLIGQLRDAKDAGQISLSELSTYLRDLERIPSTSELEEEELKGMRYYDLLKETLQAHRATNSPAKEYVCERCGMSFEAPTDLIDPYLGEEGFELCDSCLRLRFDEFTH